MVLLNLIFIREEGHSGMKQFRSTAACYRVYGWLLPAFVKFKFKFETFLFYSAAQIHSRHFGAGGLLHFLVLSGSS